MLRVNLFLVTSSGKIIQNNVLYESSGFFRPPLNSEMASFEIPFRLLL
jgi:hypothetical protein